MNQSTLALVIILLAIPTAAYGQSVARAMEAAKGRAKTESSDDRALAERALVALKRLENDVILYRSLGEFEASGKLARVPVETFRSDLREASASVEAILSQMSPGRLKSEIGNALSSYHDGAFWWAKIYQPRVINVSAWASSEITRAPFDTAYLSTIPYTVAINWRQASKNIVRAEHIMETQR